jgi:hypothetical protein
MVFYLHNYQLITKIWLNKNVLEHYLVPAPFTTQAMIKARNVNKKGRTSENPDRPVLSAFLNEVRTHFEKKFCLQAEKSQSKK